MTPLLPFKFYLNIMKQTYTMVNIKFEPPLLYRFLNALAVAGVARRSCTPQPVIHEAAHLVVPTPRVVFTEAVSSVTHNC